jgi:hypothetical protein
MERKAAGTTYNRNKAFSQGTVNERTAQHWSKKFRNAHYHCALRFPHAHFIIFPCINTLPHIILNYLNRKPELCNSMDAFTPGLTDTGKILQFYFVT